MIFLMKLIVANTNIKLDVMDFFTLYMKTIHGISPEIQLFEVISKYGD